MRFGKVIAANQQDAVPSIRQEVVVEIPQIPVGETADTDVEQASARAEDAVRVVCGTDWMRFNVLCFPANQDTAIVFATCTEHLVFAFGELLFSRHVGLVPAFVEDDL